MMDEGQLTRAVFSAYDKLGMLEKSGIDALALELRETIKESHPNAMLGKESAIELLGKLGAFLIKSDVHTSVYDGGETGQTSATADSIVKWNPSPIWNSFK